MAMKTKIDVGELTRKRNAVRQAVKNCTNCPLGGKGNNVPFFGSVHSPKFVVIAEAPGDTEVRQGRPLVGRSGKMLWAELDKYKIHRSEVLTMNAASCRPTSWLSGELKNRTPTRDEISACSGVFRMQLSLVSHCRFILVLGGIALRKFKPDAKITDWVGKPILWKDHVVVPTFHPAAVMRDRELIEPFSDAIQLLVNMVMLGEKFGDIMPVFCNRCGETEIYQTRDQLDWCGDCYLAEYQLALDGIERAKPTKVSVGKNGKVLRGRVKK